MSAKSGKVRYEVRIQPESIDALRAFAADLGFEVETKGRYFGDPSPPDLVDALAAFYLAHPQAAVEAFSVLGITKNAGESKTE